MEIVREAVNKLTDGLKSSHPEVAWKDAKSMRNFLIHVYFSIDYNIVWNTIQQDLPAFKIQITNCLKEL